MSVSATERAIISSSSSMKFYASSYNLTQRSSSPSAARSPGALARGPRGKSAVVERFPAGPSGRGSIVGLVRVGEALAGAKRSAWRRETEGKNETLGARPRSLAPVLRGVVSPGALSAHRKV